MLVDPDGLIVAENQDGGKDLTDPQPPPTLEQNPALSRIYWGALSGAGQSQPAS